MKDCKGVELKTGDHVVYVHGKNSTARLETGRITKFYTDQYGQPECSVNSASHIQSIRIMKLDNT